MHLVGFLSSYFAHDARSQDPKAYTNLLSRWKTISFWKQSLFHATNYQKGKERKRLFFHRAWLKLVNCSKEYLWGTYTHRDLCLQVKLYVFIKVCRVELKWDHAKPYRPFWNVFGAETVPSCCCCCQYEYLRPRKSRSLYAPRWYQRASVTRCLWWYLQAAKSSKVFQVTYV